MPLHRPYSVAEQVRELTDAVDFLVLVAGQAYFAMPDGLEKIKLGIALTPFHDQVAHFAREDATR